MKLILDFPDDETRQQWIGWYMDAGGEQSFNDCQDMHDEPILYCDTATALWPWQTEEGGPARKPPLPEYTIKLRRQSP